MTRRIRILVDSQRNQRLLEQWAREVELAPAEETADADLVLLDGPAFAREREELRRLRAEAAPAYLPCILLTPHRHVTMVTSELWRDVDEVVTTPIRIGELRVRAERLLLVRQQSLDAQRGLQRLVRSNTDLQEFAFVAAHELVAPLAIVSGVLDTVADRFAQDAEPTVRMLLGEGQNGARRLQALIDDLLAYSRAGRETALVPVELAPLAAQAVEMLTPQIDAAAADVEVEPLPTVLGDAAQLRIVFSNLVGNALKYRSPVRAPRVRVSAARDDGCWCVSVADNGIGVQPSRAEAIFEMFERGRDGMAQSGSGIGLALCRRIVERHGGRIWVDAADVGSVFRFTLQTA